MHQHLGRRYPNIVADAGYESEENYAYLKAHKQTAYIKPNNYEASKTRKWKHDIGRRENMQYLPDEDAYLCSEGRKLVVSGIRHAKSRTGRTARARRTASMATTASSRLMSARNILRWPRFSSRNGRKT